MVAPRGQTLDIGFTMTNNLVSDMARRVGNTTTNSISSADDDALSVDVYGIPDSFGARVLFCLQEKRHAIGAYAVCSKRAGHVPGPAELTKSEHRNLPRRVRSFLAWLGTSVQMTPRFKAETSIDRHVKLMFNDNQYHFAEELREHARALYESWEADNWGELFIHDEESDQEGGHPMPHGAVAANPPELPTVAVPPASDPIFGQRGIMHGVVISRGPGGHRTYKLDTRFRSRQHDAKVFGHNELAPGAWWPFQIVALFNGAHGAAMGGIAGNEQWGAYSVVISGMYEDLDQDDGDVVYYSGSKAHDNDDPRHLPHPTRATKLLHTSISTQRPIRVLRSANAHRSRYAPKVGIRYDGLYHAAHRQVRPNTKGGLYERFRLERLPGQSRLSDICDQSPTALQMRDFARIVHGYSYS